MITCQKSSIKVLTDDPTITLKKFRKIRLKTTDDPTITFRFFRRTLPMIRRSQFGFFWWTLPMIRWSHFGFFDERPMIRRSQFGFFDERYRWSDDHISVFSTNATDDPTITFRFLPTIRRSSLPTIRWSDDHHLPTIRWSSWGLIYRWSDDHLYPLYRWSDDHKKLYSAKILPMIRWSKKKFHESSIMIIGSSVKKVPEFGSKLSEKLKPCCAWLLWESANKCQQEIGNISIIGREL